MKPPMNKEQFVRELSLLSGFTLADTEVFFNSFIRLLAKCIEGRIPFIIKGFASLKFTTIKARTGYHGEEKKKIELPEATRVTLSLAGSLKEYVSDLPESPHKQMTFLDK